MIIFKRYILRTDLVANPDTYYLFGDNVKRYGLGGQAREMRGEPNAIGIATKWAPDNLRASYFSDENEKCLEIVQADFAKVFDLVKNNKDIVVPADGLGTGLSNLQLHAPELLKFIGDQIDALCLLAGKVVYED